MSNVITKQPAITKEQARKALLEGAARGLDLVPRMKARWRARGWPEDDRLHIATAAVCCVALGVGPTPWKIPPGTDDPECWIVLLPAATSYEIVRSLELEDMLKPAHQTVTVTAGTP